MARLSYERYCIQIVRQTNLLLRAIDGADLATPVPSCPGWALRDLLDHVGRLHRWAAHVVRTQAGDPVPVDDEHAPDEPARVGGWLVEGAARLATALREIGPATSVWTPMPGDTTDFYARRFTNETAVHRADATLAVGAAYELAADIAADAIDEWLELSTSRLPGSLEPGRVRLHATDVDATWQVGPASEATVVVRAPLTELLLLVYRRRPADGVDVVGDRELLRTWLAHTGLGEPA